MVFKVSENASEEEVKRQHRQTYPHMTKTMGNFHLEVETGHFSDSEILVMLGENGTGKKIKKYLKSLLWINYDLQILY